MWMRINNSSFVVLQREEEQFIKRLGWAGGEQVGLISVLRESLRMSE